MCGDGKACISGACVAVEVECEAGETRACGNEAKGRCKPGTQKCVNGKFETSCPGEVKPSTELCNELDDDCDGEVDENLATLWYPDADGDGHGAAAGPAVSNCTPPQGHVAVSDDCNDSPNGGATAYPGASEVCDTASVDEDCDGTANEGCGCPNIGATTPCCANRGTQTCQANGMLSACSVSATTEACNAVDDDCDGQVDEGGAGLCANGQQCTAGSCGCPAGQALCNGVCAPVGSETCDGTDNDCNGTIDDGAPAPTSTDGGSLEFDGGVILANGTCTVGRGECAASGMPLCVAGGAGCSASPGTPSGELCNNLDDDCNGVVDDGTQSAMCRLVTGQVCTAGACVCPGSQSVCNGACVTLSTEVCDGLDNDCDGDVDEALRFTCLPDADGDGYADSSTTSQQCPVGNRPQFGNCPVGYVAQANSLGADCNAGDVTRYRLVSSRNDGDADTYCSGAPSDDCVGLTALPGRRFAPQCNPTNDDCNDNANTAFRIVSSRADADNDAYCTGAANNDCVGATALPGRRFASSCNASDDCNDNAGALYQLVNSRTDADNDTYCVGLQNNDCVGAVPLVGRRFTSSCNASDDCNDSSNALFRNMASRNDRDNDSYCEGASTNDCVGAVSLPGRRFTAACLDTDCDDMNGGVFRNASVRFDGDNDQWCQGATQTLCIGNSPPAGRRIATSCQGEDCKDDNAAAMSTCTIPAGYTTNYRSSTCPSPVTTSTLLVSALCPAGFYAANHRSQVSAGNGFCSYVSPTQISQSCNFLEGTTCRVVADCYAQ